MGENIINTVVKFDTGGHVIWGVLRDVCGAVAVVEEITMGHELRIPIAELRDREGRRLYACDRIAS